MSLWTWLRRLLCMHLHVESEHDVIVAGGLVWHRCRKRLCKDCGATMPSVCPPDEAMARARRINGEALVLVHGGAARIAAPPTKEWKS